MYEKISNISKISLAYLSHPPIIRLDFQFLFFVIIPVKKNNYDLRSISMHVHVWKHVVN